MAEVNPDILRKISKYLELVKENGINIYRAYLYGSFATNKFHENSDIDIAIISENFIGIGAIDIDKISGISRKVDSRISALTLSLDSVNSLFVNAEIIQKGIRVH